MTELHKGMVCEDDPRTSAEICETVASLGHEPVPVTTLEEMRAYFASGRRPCYVLEDMQMPYKHGANPHEATGESGIQLTRSVSSGRFRIPCIVLTAFSSKPRFVTKTIKLGADEFLEKSEMHLLADAIRQWLRETGREDHAECARCNERSRPPAAPPESKEEKVVARLLSHEHANWHGIDEEELARVIARRRELDLFLNARDEEVAGYLAGRRDLRGNYRETYIPKLHAEILVEVIEAGKPVRATALKCLRAGGVAMDNENAVRLVQRARQAIDVHALVKGRESRRAWRAIHTTGEKNAAAFWFLPPGGMRWMVVGAADSSL